MRIKPLVVLLSLWLCLVCPVYAQSHTPLVIQLDGQVYRWSPGESKPTFTGCDLQGNRLNVVVYTMTQSSDGKWATFMALPEEYLGGAPSATGNVWVCQLETGDAYALTTLDPGMVGLASVGVFSPDSRSLIWTEIADDPNYSTLARLMIHDLKTHTSRVLVDEMPLEWYCGIGGGLPEIVWGEAGIVAAYKTLKGEPCSDESEASPFGISLYSAEGTLLNSFLLPDGTVSVDTIQWLAESEPRLAILARRQACDEDDCDEGEPRYEMQMYSMDMTTGAVQPEETVLEAFIPEAEDGGRIVSVEPISLYGPDRQHMDFPGGDDALEGTVDAALSPDAALLAIVIGHTLYFADDTGLTPAAWNDDYNNQIDDVQYGNMGQIEIAWTPPSYRLVLPSESLCPDEESQINGDSWFVHEGRELRSAPSLHAEDITTLPESDVLLLKETINGPVFDGAQSDALCSGGMYWHEIGFWNEDNTGFRGWIAESADDQLG